jgi:hypothetical protein
MRLMIAVCCVVAWGGVACAKEKHADTQGAGLMSCAKYAEAYRKTPALADAVFLAWAQGYISGLNAGVEEAYDAYFDLGAKTPDEMQRFLRKYCNDRPLANIIDAAIEFAKSLPRLKRPPEGMAP